jgi:hypothetical protein
MGWKDYVANPGSAAWDQQLEANGLLLYQNRDPNGVIDPTYAARLQAALGNRAAPGWNQITKNVKLNPSTATPTPGQTPAPTQKPASQFAPGQAMPGYGYPTPAPQGKQPGDPGYQANAPAPTLPPLPNWMSGITGTASELSQPIPAWAQVIGNFAGKPLPGAVPPSQPTSGFSAHPGWGEPSPTATHRIDYPAVLEVLNPDGTVRSNAQPARTVWLTDEEYQRQQAATQAAQAQTTDQTAEEERALMMSNDLMHTIMAPPSTTDSLGNGGGYGGGGYGGGGWGGGGWGGGGRGYGRRSTSYAKAPTTVSNPMINWNF